MSKKTVLKARLLLFHQNKILLLHQTKKNGGNLTLVGGTIEKTEHARASLIRESREEAGINIRQDDLQLAHVLHKRTSRGHRMTLYFKTTIWNGKPKSNETNKFKKVDWYPVNRLPNKLTATVRHVLIQVKKGLIYSEFTKNIPIT